MSTEKKYNYSLKNILPKKKLLDFYSLAKTTSLTYNEDDKEDYYKLLFRNTEGKDGKPFPFSLSHKAGRYFDENIKTKNKQKKSNPNQQSTNNIEYVIIDAENLLNLKNNEAVKLLENDLFNKAEQIFTNILKYIIDSEIEQITGKNEKGLLNIFHINNKHEKLKTLMNDENFDNVIDVLFDKGENNDIKEYIKYSLQDLKNKFNNTDINNLQITTDEKEQILHYILNQMKNDNVYNGYIMTILANTYIKN